jgi:hypothetical protein
MLKCASRTIITDIRPTLWLHYWSFVVTSTPSPPTWVATRAHIYVYLFLPHAENYFVAPHWRCQTAPTRLISTLIRLNLHAAVKPRARHKNGTLWRRGYKRVNGCETLHSAPAAKVGTRTHWLLALCTRSIHAYSGVAHHPPAQYQLALGAEWPARPFTPWILPTFIPIHNTLARARTAGKTARRRFFHSVCAEWMVWIEALGMNLNTHKYIHTHNLLQSRVTEIPAIHAKGEIYFVAQEIFAKTSFTDYRGARSGIFSNKSLPIWIIAFCVANKCRRKFVLLYLGLLFRGNLFLILWFIAMFTNFVGKMSWIIKVFSLNHRAENLAFITSDRQIITTPLWKLSNLGAEG